MASAGRTVYIMRRISKYTVLSAALLVVAEMLFSVVVWC